MYAEICTKSLGADLNPVYRTINANAFFTMLTNAFLSTPQTFLPLRLQNNPETIHHQSPRCTIEQPSARDQLYALVTSTNNRTQPNSQLDPLISTLESQSQTNTATNPNLIGTWRNVYTTTPSTSSIIQRTVVSSAFVPRVEQVIHPDPNNRPLKILNRVDLRKALGCILNVRAAVENIHNSRLHIRFDRAWFEFDALPAWLGGATLPTVVHVPYPVPFRLLGDKVSGWLDVTYLDSDMRISRGNRGSCFVLVKERQNPLPLTLHHLT